jgi:hypothetical protein
MTDDVPYATHVSHDFDFLFGTWRVQHRRLRQRLAGSDQWDESEGWARCAPILGGVGNFDQIGVPAADTVGATLRLFDAAAAQWSIHWSSSRTGRLEPVMIGTFRDGVGTFYGADVHAGARITVRFIWDDIGPSAARWSQAFAPAGTDDWETNWVMSFVRVSHEAHAATTDDIPAPPVS